MIDTLDALALYMNTVIHSDCLEALRALPDNSIDALVSDPPAAISFMSKSWDSDRGGRTQWIAWLSEVLSEVYRVLKPGAHGLVWALPRTSHWTACALEDAGFTIRDCIYHLFGSGFPKSANISKMLQSEGFECKEGLGTALKPSVEYWWLVRKPISERSVAANVQRWGTGAINIDACRVAATDNYGPVETKGATKLMDLRPWNEKERQTYVSGSTLGRWPSHLLLSHSVFCHDGECVEDCPVRALDEQSGMRKGHKNAISDNRSQLGGSVALHNTSSLGMRTPENSYGDIGGASRYFQTFWYSAKASRAERNAGCEDLPARAGFDKNTSQQIAHINHQTGETTYSEYTPSTNQNNHPTVKPQSLMRYLVRLIVPDNGIVLDPFGGSGSTALACIAENKRFILIEREADYVEIARARIKHAEEQE